VVVAAPTRPLRTTTKRGRQRTPRFCYSSGSGRRTAHARETRVSSNPGVRGLRPITTAFASERARRRPAAGPAVAAFARTGLGPYPRTCDDRPSRRIRDMRT
jgi:hypothetical protein